MSVAMMIATRAMPRPIDPYSNCRQMKVAMVCTPTGASTIEATSSREVSAKTNLLQGTGACLSKSRPSFRAAYSRSMPSGYRL